MILIVLFGFSFEQLKSQSIYKPTKEDRKALENVIVEKYYIATDDDVNDSIGGKLAKGSITYRIYIDLKSGYKLEMVYGYGDHPLNIETTTCFFNDTIRGESTGDNINKGNFNVHNVLLDSWVTMGGVSKFYNGVLLTEDTDSSIIKKRSQLSKVDGLIYQDIYGTIFFGNDLRFFLDSIKPKKFYTENGLWANYKYAEGPTESNRILVAQLTTNGKLSFELNIQVATPTGEPIKFVARNMENLIKENKNSEIVEIFSKYLTYNQ